MRIKLILISTLLWAGVVGVSYLSQLLVNGVGLPQVDLIEQSNTFLYGVTLIILIGYLQFLPKFPQLLETRWFLFQMIISAFSYLVYNSLFVEISVYEEGSFVVKESNLGFSIIDNIFGNGFGIFSIVLVVFSLLYRKMVPVAETIQEPEQKKPDLLEKLKIKLANKTYFVYTKDIRFIKSSNNYSDIYTKEGKHVIRESLTKLEEKLDQKEFIRIHRSVLIRTDEVSEFLSSGTGDYKIKMKSGELLNVGNTYKKLVLERFGI